MEQIYAYSGQLLAGTWVTVQLALYSLVLAVLFGLLGAWAKLSTNRAAQTAASAYTTLIRGVPDLVLMLLVFFGGQTLFNSLGEVTGLWDYVEISQMIAGVGTIGFIFGAYMTETFRGAILAVPQRTDRGWRKPRGMSGPLLFRRIIWPQMVRYALPSFTNNWLVQIKSTALGFDHRPPGSRLQCLCTAGRSTRQLFTFMLRRVRDLFDPHRRCLTLGLRWVDRKYSRGVVRAA